jgi:hypothetical protein
MTISRADGISFPVQQVLHTLVPVMGCTPGHVLQEGVGWNWLQQGGN